MFGKIARTLAILAPALALAACGSSREEELAQQLEQAKTTAAEEAAARKAAEREASTLRSRARDAALASFYAGDGGNEEPAPVDDAPVFSPGDAPADDSPPPDGPPMPEFPAGNG